MEKVATDIYTFLELRRGGFAYVDKTGILREMACGEEVLKYFPGRIHALAGAQGLSDEGAFAEIVRWYDGYRFHHAAEPVINPVSLGKCLQKGEFGNYEPDNPRDTTLLYQTGYLTISGFRNIGGSRLYSLDFPNREVRESFLHDVAPVYSGLREDVAGGISFSSERRTIVEELVEEISPCRP